MIGRVETMKTMETESPSHLFVTPRVQVLELRLPAVAAELHLKERIGFLRLSPFLRSARSACPTPNARMDGARPSALRIRASLLEVRDAVRRALVRAICGFRAERITIVHSEQSKSGQPLARIPRVYLN